MPVVSLDKVVRESSLKSELCGIRTIYLEIIALAECCRRVDEASTNEVSEDVMCCPWRAHHVGRGLIA